MRKDSWLCSPLFTVTRSFFLPANNEAFTVILNMRRKWYCSITNFFKKAGGDVDNRRKRHKSKTFRFRCTVDVTNFCIKMCTWKVMPTTSTSTTSIWGWSSLKLNHLLNEWMNMHIMKEKTPNLLYCHLYSAGVPSFHVQIVFPVSPRLTPNRLTHKYSTKSKRSTYTCLWQRCVGDLMGFGRKQVLMNIQ